MFGYQYLSQALFFDKHLYFSTALMPGFSHLIAACLHLSPTTCLHALSITPLPIIYPFSLNALYCMRFACFSKYADFPQVLEVPLVHKHSNLLTIYAHSGGVSCDSLLSLDETTPLMLPYSQDEKTNDNRFSDPMRVLLQ